MDEDLLAEELMKKLCHLVAPQPPPSPICLAEEHFFSCVAALV